MFKSIRFLCAAALLSIVGVAHAVSPSRGLWWNPNQSGRGYVIDRQGGTMTVSIYAYDASGSSTWYLGAGDFSLDQANFVADFYSYSGGQCLGCTYSSPLGTAFGTVSIQFTDSEHAVLSYPGGGEPIEHFNYGYASKQDRLLGYWSFSGAIANGDAYGPQTLGEFLLFDSHESTNGSVYVSGHGFVDPSVTALGSYSDADDSYTVDVTLPDGTIHHYVLQGDDTLLIGQSSYGNSDPTGAIATRIEYYSPQVQSGPASPASVFGRSTRFPQR